MRFAPGRLQIRSFITFNAATLQDNVLVVFHTKTPSQLLILAPEKGMIVNI